MEDEEVRVRSLGSGGAVVDRWREETKVEGSGLGAGRDFVESEEKRGEAPSPISASRRYYSTPAHFSPDRRGPPEPKEEHSQLD